MLWRKKKDGTREKIPKLLITISIRQLHNDMLESPLNGGLAGAKNVNGEVIISDTALRDNLPFNLRPIQERHKQVCGCTLFTVMEEYHRSLCKYHMNLVEYLIWVDKTKADRDKTEVFSSGTELKKSKSRQEPNNVFFT